MLVMEELEHAKVKKSECKGRVETQLAGCVCHRPSNPIFRKHLLPPSCPLLLLSVMREGSFWQHMLCCRGHRYKWCESAQCGAISCWSRSFGVVLQVGRLGGGGAGHRQARGATIYPEFLGGSFTCDAYHMTEPHPNGTTTHHPPLLAGPGMAKQGCDGP